MKQTRLIMGMPISIEILGALENAPIFSSVFDYFKAVDERFSTYKPESEISQINKELASRHQVSETGLDTRCLQAASPEMQEIFDLAEKTKKETGDYFDIRKPDGSLDPSGIVKGWAIHNAAKIIDLYGLARGRSTAERFHNFYVEAGGDIEVRGLNANNQKWRVGIRNPFKPSENVKIVLLSNMGIATSGNYERGKHIYNPHTGEAADAIASISVIGPDAPEADRFATAAFAIGKDGINFIEKHPNLEGYLIDKQGIATMTSGFLRYVGKDA